MHAEQRTDKTCVKTLTGLSDVSCADPLDRKSETSMKFMLLVSLFSCVLARSFHFSQSIGPLDSLGGGRILKRGLDPLGGGRLLKRSLDSLSGGRILKRGSFGSNFNADTMERTLENVLFEPSLLDSLEYETVFYPVLGNQDMAQRSFEVL